MLRCLGWNFEFFREALCAWHGSLFGFWSYSLAPWSPHSAQEKSHHQAKRTNERRKTNIDSSATKPRHICRLQSLQTPSSKEPHSQKNTAQLLQTKSNQVPSK